MVTNVKTGAYLKQQFNAAVALGDKVVSSDAQFVIDGYEDIALLTKQFPWPTLAPGGEIEVPIPNGAAMWQPQQLKVHQQGQMTFLETQKGHIQQFLEDIVFVNGAIFDATIYEGTREDYTRKERIARCFLQLDNPDRDWENRTQILQVTGTLFFHYFGKEQ